MFNPLAAPFVAQPYMPVVHLHQPPPFVVPPGPSIVPQLQPHEINYEQLSALQQWHTAQEHLPPPKGLEGSSGKGPCAIWMYGIPSWVTGNELEGLTEWQSTPCLGFTGVTIYRGGATDRNDLPREGGAFAVFKFLNIHSAWKGYDHIDANKKHDYGNWRPYALERAHDL
ncbi:hypothetical protein WJX73_004049 [Symbiochloris irregularis]|uniref:Uncharacterized protein n=1 Tax=Symbiochloris irregularis TaxID=706552 RepID=A0AAW1NNS4_9CHLO